MKKLISFILVVFLMIQVIALGAWAENNDTTTNDTDAEEVTETVDIEITEKEKDSGPEESGFKEQRRKTGLNEDDEQELEQAIELENDDDVIIADAAAKAGNSTGIEISEENFPDSSFRAYVQKNCDSDSNGVLSQDEIADVKEISVFYQNISSLQGIQFFEKLTRLICSYNNLTELDLRENTALRNVSCDSNRLTSLKVSKDSLEILECDKNKLRNLDVDGADHLYRLSCRNNSLEYLDVSNTPFLQSLYCGDNSLKQLIVGNLAKLSVLSCDNNMLYSLDLSSCPALRVLYCYGNNIKDLEIYGCPYLKDAFFGTMSEETEGYITYRSYVSANGDKLAVDTTTKIWEKKRIPVSDEYFPDSVFRSFVLDRIDSDDDNYLSPREIATVTEIDVTGMNIWDLEGLWVFSGLQTLLCGGNHLQSLDVSGNPLIERLDCSNNQLLVLDLSENIILEELDCHSNLLETLKVCGQTLRDVNCRDNALSELNLCDCPQLVTAFHGTKSEQYADGKPYYLYAAGNNRLAADQWVVVITENVSANTDVSGLLSIIKPSMEELRSRYDAIPSVNSLFKTESIISGTNYRPAVLSDEAYSNALGWINYYRLAAGVEDIRFTEWLNLSASYGALGMAMLSNLAHEITKPEDMTEEDYIIAYDATTHSNISFYGGYSEFEVPKSAVQGQIDDSDSSNIQTVGHRQWLLNPAGQMMGIGTALNENNSLFGLNLPGYYTAIRVFGDDVEMHEDKDYDFVAWPASGINMSDTFTPEVPWSITLNADRYDDPTLSSVQVVLTRKSDGKRWLFNENTDSERVGNTYDFFNVVNRSTPCIDGVTNAIIFRPAYDEIPVYEGEYMVDVYGIYDKMGKETSLHYSVRFASYDSDFGHDYQLTEWIWQDGYDYAKAVFVCANDNSHQKIIEATVTGPQNGVYTASVIGPDGRKYTYSVSAEVADPVFKSQSLVLSGQIGLNFFLELPEIPSVDYSKSYMTFKIGKDTTEYRDDFDPNHMNTGKTRYGFTCYVNSIQMADTITAVFHYGNNQTVTKEYSVAQYIDFFEKNIGSFNAKTITLIRAIADFGHYEQVYLAAVNGWEIGETYTEMTTYYIRNFDYEGILTEVSGKAFVKSLSGSKVSKATYKLHLDSTTTVDVLFSVPSGTSLTAWTTFNGKNYNSVKQPDGRYLLRIPDIAAHQLGEMITINGSAGGGFTVKVSALSYVRSVLANNLTVPEKNGMAALYQYYTAVLAYRS